MAGRPFITTWRTDHPGESEDDQILIPATGHKFQIDWEEVGNPDNSGSQLGFGETLLTFPHSGAYQVSIKGHLSRINFSNLNDHLKIVSIDQWGDISWSTMDRAFYGCNNLVYNALDTPDLSRVTSLYSMFRECFLLDGDLRGWEFHNVTNMGSMFNHAFVFNGDISDWDVSNVEDMSWMFNKAYEFNQPIGKWDVSSVTDMRWMFGTATSFNQPLEDWDVSSVWRMPLMFFEASAFNQPVESWDVSSVENMFYMFHDASSFNQSLGSWVFHKEVYTEEFLEGSNMSCKNYDKSIIGWNNNPLSPDSVRIDVRTLNYWLGENARDSLINIKGWRVGGRYKECNYLCDLPLPVILYEDHLSLCEGDSLILSAENPGFHYLWFKNGKKMHGEIHSSLVVTESGQYSLLYLDEEGCESEMSETIEVIMSDNRPVMTNAVDTVFHMENCHQSSKMVFEADILLCSGSPEKLGKNSRWQLDLFNNGTFEILSTEPRPDQSLRNPLIIEEILPLGTHRVRWELVDEFGNSTTTEHLIHIVGPNPPTPVCIHGITASINPVTGQTSLPAWMFDAGSFDPCSDTGDLIFSFSNDPAHTHHTWTCDDLNGLSQKTIEVDMWITNDHGHQSHCTTYLLLQDNHHSCHPSENTVENPIAMGLENELDTIRIDNPLGANRDYSPPLQMVPSRPNPFSEQTTIDFYLPQSSATQLNIFHSSGRLVATFSGDYAQGHHEIDIHRSDLSGGGMYFYRLQTTGFVQSGKMILME